jgi:hypothetical protein
MMKPVLITNATKPYTVIPMYVDSCYVAGHAPTISLKTDIHLRLASTFHRFGVGAVPVGGTGRNMRGIDQEGPWAYTYGLCTVIDNYPERRKAEYDADVIVDEGDLLMIDAKCYRVVIVRREFIELQPVETPAKVPTMAEAELLDAAAKHRYEITVRRDLIGNRPYVQGEQFDIVRVLVDANTRTQAASRVKRHFGWMPADVNMIG